MIIVADQSRLIDSAVTNEFGSVTGTFGLFEKLLVFTMQYCLVTQNSNLKEEFRFDKLIFLDTFVNLLCQSFYLGRI